MTASTEPTSTTEGATAWKGLSPRTLEQFGVNFGVVGWRVPYWDSEGTLHRVKLFAADGEEFEGGKGNKGHRTRWLGPKKPQIPYGAWKLRTADKRALILTEGESDTWALAEALPNICALGIPGSSSWKTGWVGALENFGAIYLSFDADSAGRSLADDVMRDYTAARYVHLPEGADTRSFLQRCGVKAYSQLLREAEATYRIRRAMKIGTTAIREAQAVREAWDG